MIYAEELNKKYMLREKFNELIMQETTYGFNRGIELFIESLNEDLARDEALEENEANIENYIEALFEGAR